MMRVRISIDSASTADIRALARALNRAGKGGSMTVGLNGPEHWTAETPPLYPVEFQILLSEIGDSWGRSS